MITAITIENFKGIRERVRLELKPITLLFGPNSAGKSTILQALHYAREVLERRNLNADRTASGGAFIDLGGFRNFVHNRDLSRTITFRFELDLRGRNRGTLDIFDLDAVQRHGLVPQLERAWVEFSIGAWLNQSLHVTRYSVGINGETVGTICFDPASSRCELTGINWDFSWRDWSGDAFSLADLFTKDHPDGGNACAVTLIPDAIEISSRDPIPDLRHGIEYGLSLPNGFYGASEPRFVRIVSDLMTAPGALLRAALGSFRYLGPSRAVPSRDYITPRSPDAARWAGGLAAWDQLSVADPGQIEVVNSWLSSPHRLDTGYGVRLKWYREVEVERGDLTEPCPGGVSGIPSQVSHESPGLPLRRRLCLVKEGGEGEVQPQDVGMGISQVLPLVVACVLSAEGMFCVEQPELHLHPRLQAELGDLLITGALKSREVELQRWSWSGDDVPARADFWDPRAFIVETHSEHLILRILRRIRETTRGQPHNGIRVTPDDVAVWYVSQEDGQSVPRTIGVDEHGEFTVPWPDDFFEQDFYERFG